MGFLFNPPQFALMDVRIILRIWFFWFKLSYFAVITNFALSALAQNN